MIKELIKIKKILPQLLIEKINNNEVKTMYIDYHKPFVSRIWFKYNDLRIFLHKIETCDDPIEALYHPHEWDSAMEILKGSYEMGTGFSNTDEIPKTVCKLILSEGSKYEMTEPDGWHYVSPISNPTYTLMVTGKLNGRKMPISPNKGFRELNKNEILDILNTIDFDISVNKLTLAETICK